LLDRARCSCAIFFNSDDYAHTVGAGNPSVVGSEADIVLRHDEAADNSISAIYGRKYSYNVATNIESWPQVHNTKSLQ
jgi:hypothetical protein